MALVNEHFLKLASNYLFADIAKKVNAYKIAHLPCRHQGDAQGGG